MAGGIRAIPDLGQVARTFLAVADAGQDRVGAARPVLVVPHGDVSLDAVDAIADQARELLSAAAVAGSGAFVVVFTSGSTRGARAVLRSMSSWLESHDTFTRRAGLQDDDVVWVPGTAESTLSLYAAVHAQATGLELVTSGPWRGVKAALESSVHGLDTGGSPLRSATVLHAVPAVVADVLASLDEFPRLQHIVTAGAVVPQQLRRDAEAAGLRFSQYYGAAELSFVAWDDGGGYTAFPEVSVQVRDGVLWAQTPAVAATVLHTNQAWEPIADAQGWATVGDRAELAGAHLKLLGRPDIALVGGNTVHLSDVEAALNSAQVQAVACAVPATRDAARLGQDISVTLCSTDSENAPAPEDMIAKARAVAREVLPVAARPRHYRVVTALPLSAAGKPDRRVLAEEWAQHLQDDYS